MSTKLSHVIFAPITEADLASFREICRRRQRTTEFVAGEILQAWIEQEKREPARAAGERPGEPDK